MTDAVERAQEVLPREMAGQPPRLRQGAVATTDPTQAVGVGTLLLVSSRRADALRALEAAAPAAAHRLESGSSVAMGAGFRAGCNCEVVVVGTAAYPATYAGDAVATGA